MVADTPNTRFGALLGLMKPHAGRWVAVLGLVALSAGALITGPLILRRVVDRALDGADATEIRDLGLLFIAIATVGLIATVASVYAATVSAWRTTNVLRVRITRHVLRLDHEFHRTHTPGELISRVDGDVTSVSDFLGNVMVKALRSFVILIGAIGVLAVVAWPLAVAMLLFLVVGLVVMRIVRHRAIDESGAEMSANAALYGGIEERLNASEDLRASGAIAHAINRFLDESRDVVETSERRSRAFMVMWWAVQGTVTVGIVTSLVASAILVGDGTMTVGTALLLFQYVLLVSTPLEEIIHELETVQKAIAALQRVIALLGEQATIRYPGDAVPAPGPLEVVADSISFDYGDDQPVLTEVNATVAAGRRVGVVGRTGSGKTTFSRLLLRLVEASSGQLRLNGVPIAEIPRAELRHRVALIPQEVELFGASVRDNVTLFNNTPTDADVSDALRAVGLDTLAAGGLDRVLGPAGGGLSAGEGQLLSLARVWLRQPDLIVLDEATARVDPDTEAKIDRAVRALTEGRTTFFIAHRLSTLQTVDEIMVFDHGRLVEHDDRLALEADVDSRFARLLEVAAARPEALA